MIDDEQEYNNFLISWDIYGVESIINLDAILQQEVEAKLKETSINNIVSMSYIIDSHLMRARLNSHRNYEIWSIKLPIDINTDDIFKMFDIDLQAIVNLIRRRGVCIFS